MSALTKKENGHGYEIVPPIPKPDGKLLDPQGHTVRPAKLSRMARLDAKASQKVEISQGTIWLLGIGLALAGFIAGYVLPSVREGAKAEGASAAVISEMKKDVDESRSDMKELKVQFDQIQKALNEQAVRDAERKGQAYGYDVGRSDRNKGGH